MDIFWNNTMSIFRSLNLVQLQSEDRHLNQVNLNNLVGLNSKLVRLTKSSASEPGLTLVTWKN